MIIIFLKFNLKFSLYLNLCRQVNSMFNSCIAFSPAIVTTKYSLQLDNMVNNKNMQIPSLGNKHFFSLEKYLKQHISGKYPRGQRATCDLVRAIGFAESVPRSVSSLPIRRSDYCLRYIGANGVLDTIFGCRATPNKVRRQRGRAGREDGIYREYVAARIGPCGPRK